MAKNLSTIVRSSSYTGVSLIRQSITATANQTVFTLNSSYVMGNNSLSVYINGVKQFPGTYTETSSNSVTLSTGVTVGTVVLFESGILTTGQTTPAGLVSYAPTGNLVSTTAQAAITEINSNIRRAFNIAAVSA